MIESAREDSILQPKSLDDSGEGEGDGEGDGNDDEKVETDSGSSSSGGGDDDEESSTDNADNPPSFKSMDERKAFLKTDQFKKLAADLTPPKFCYEAVNGEKAFPTNGKITKGAPSVAAAAASPSCPGACSRHWARSGTRTAVGAGSAGRRRRAPAAGRRASGAARAR